MFPRFDALASLFYLLPIGFLWWRLVDQLRIEWSVNPQYAYGWAVPFLCAYLLWQRLRNTEGRQQRADGGRETAELEGRRKEGRGQKPEVSLSTFRFQLFFWCLALLYFPTRLIQEANPDWRIVSWALALEVIGLTLLVLGQMMEDGGRIAAFQRFSVSDFLFPVLFFLVAVPWPTVLEAPAVQFLTRANAALTIEILNTLGIPALQRGNVIEISAGLVGIDDACSGIRSLQATLMISLFLGELYRLSAFRRLALVLAGFALAFLFNIGRTFLLVYVASREGVAAIDKWHDPAGVTILLTCFVGLWLLGLWLARGPHTERRQLRTADGNPKPDASSQPSETGNSASSPQPSAFSLFRHRQPPTFDSRRPPPAPRPSTRFTFRRLAFAFIAWLVLTEVAVAAWYHWHERQLGAPVQWVVKFPQAADSFKALPIPQIAHQMLRYDEGKSAQWADQSAIWQVIYLRWNAGRIAAHLARSHTPEVCLTAAGHQLEVMPDMKIVTLPGIRLPFRVYSFRTEQGPVFVFYCLWEDRQRGPAFDTEMLTYGNRFTAMREGRRNLGQRSLEVAVGGLPDLEQATAALQRQLERLVQVPPTGRL